MTQKVFLNNELVDVDKACISVTDCGFLYGAGLFETMRSQNGVVFCLEDHLERLFSSAERLSIDVGCDKKHLTDVVYKLLKANNLSDARLRLTVTGGPINQPDEHRKPTLLITAVKFRPYPDEYYKNGVLVVLCPFRQNVIGPTVGHKTTSYFARMVALDLARQKRAAEALWFTVDNRLAEGCVSNVFLVKKSVLYTPSANTPVLPGIARKAVCRLAAENSVELVEKDLYIDDVLEADEIFMTNVIMQIMPVRRVEKHVVGTGDVGEVTKKLARSFDEFVKSQCRKDK